jgi:diacylglycerol kinase family enzyme
MPTTSASPERAAVLLNPAAGGGKAGKRQAALERCLRERGVFYDLFITKSEEHLRELTREKARDYPTVVGAGGDSTFQIMAEEIFRAGIPVALGIVGLGSSNDIPREFGIDSLEGAAAALKKGRARQIDLGCVEYRTGERRHFIGQANIGLGVEVNQYVNALASRWPFIRRFQKTAGILGVARAYQKKRIPVQARVTTKDREIEGSFAAAIFANIRFWATGKKLVPAALPDDGELDVCLIRPCSFFRLARLAGAVDSGLHLLAPEIEFVRAPSFEVSSPKVFAIQVDGEIIGGPASPSLLDWVRIGVIPRGLTIIA